MVCEQCKKAADQYAAVDDPGFKRQAKRLHDDCKKRNRGCTCQHRVEGQSS